MGKLIVKFMSWPDLEQEKVENNICIEVEVPFDKYPELIDNEGDLWPQVNLWMQEECEGTVVVPLLDYIVLFELESDAMAFKLRWL